VEPKDTARLIGNIEFSFVVPCVTVALGLLNVKLSPRSKINGTKLRIILSFSVILFVACVGATIYENQLALGTLFKDDPVVLTLVVLFIFVSLVIVLAGLIYWKLRPSLWTRHDK